ncbi:hypothetical protein GJ496_003066 [Pomphorhynchus laevis]|nr:hypothetical protein GJ496_003066 [Pomphorhynchus laevis]
MSVDQKSPCIDFVTDADCAICVSMLLNEVCKHSTDLSDLWLNDDNNNDDGFSSSSTSTLESEVAEVRDKFEKANLTPCTEVKNELNNTDSELADLPPIEDLHITIGDDVHLEVLGHVEYIIDKPDLIVVKSNFNAKVLDEGTVLFLENRQSLGRIVDLFGPVSSPFYAIKPQWFMLKISANDCVYYAEMLKDLTNFVFTKDLYQPGTDASWVNDDEPPVNAMEFSDDEKERMFKKTLKRKANAANVRHSDLHDQHVVNGKSRQYLKLFIELICRIH